MYIQEQCLLKVIVITALLLVAASVSGSIAGAADTDEIAWQIEIKVVFTSDQIKQPGWEENTRALQNALATRLQSNGTRLQAARAPNARGTELTFRADGKGTAAQFRRVAFDDLSPVGGLIGGPAALTLEGVVKRGENLSLVLESNPSTGYAWDVSQVDPAMFQAIGASQLQQTANMPGAPAKQTIKLKAAQDGAATVALVYRRPFETAEPTRRVTVRAARLAALADLSDPVAPFAAQAAPPNLPVRAPQSAGALPSHFNWASTDNYTGAIKVTSIRNQGGCGSCWAFATVAPFESNILIKDSNSRDLSEQFLVSCNLDGDGCDGGWWAHKYHYNTLGYGQSAIGAVYESAFPYVAYDAPCSSSYSHPYRLNNWYYVGSQWTVPSVDAIKNAIYNYGPVSAALCVGSGFSAYSGGVFSTNDCGSINHAITLVGWDDATSTWVLRNSWGPYWGESAYSGGERGYMRIVYGTSAVGYNATYVVYNGEPVCYSLTTAANPSDGGGVIANPAPNCSDGIRYLQGTSVSLTAQPGCGRTFQNWSGDVSGSTNPTSITMTGNKSVTANFSGSGSPCRYGLPAIFKSQSVAGWTTITTQDFEGAFPGAWIVYDSDGATYGEYYWGKRTCRPYAGSYSGWGVGAGANGAAQSCGSYYPNSAQAWMVYGPFSLVGATAAELRFKLWLNTPGYPDRVSYYASIDGVNFYGYYSNPTTGWTDKVLDLSNVYVLGNLLGQSNVWVGLRFYSDGSTSYVEGGYVDDLILRKCPTGASCPVSSPGLLANPLTIDTPAQTTLPK